GYVNKKNIDWNINSQLAILRTNKPELIGKYLLQFLLSSRGQIEFSKRQTGSALKQLPIKALKDINIPITSIKEQQKIGQFFNNLDSLITLHQRGSI
ncbi:MAG: restriction endonuclease subunit S, partial [Ligilactobacillus sp.]|nr:restriction endonuclease subunit S [Ligilactobacillus sp.]